jgi:MoxR-like ATPase
MANFLYGETPPPSRPPPQRLRKPILADAADPAGYLPDPGLVDAVNVALVLRQPLLVTGEPGTGKSHLAASVAYQLGLDPPLPFETKSTTIARDLFYTFDNIGRFRAAQTAGASSDPRLFINYNALGLAIVLANEEGAISQALPPGFVHGGRRRAVVLIDEIDKAPRDFPNDILNEIERLYFRVPELGALSLAADAEYRPVVIMTSNSEKSLPDAFLRRCIFYAIPFPDEMRLERIILSRLSGRIAAGQPLLRDAIDFFVALREDEVAMGKRPGTAELLNWLAALLDFGCDSTQPLAPQGQIVQRTLATLGKMGLDQQRVQDALKRWVQKS